ncbi:MAG: AAA family ATPase, partial [Rhodospirillales bacterium]|nr:AAA family ATPase [Rhodospirillales bacterium]
AALNGRCAALLKAVGVNGAIVTELIPEFLSILGPQPAVPPLPPSESEFRFQLTFQNLVLALTAPERPLVLFLDDLQWADRPSLGLLAKLIADPEMRHLLVIGAYRDGGMEPGQPLARMVEQVLEAGSRVEMVEIGPLSPADIRRLVAETVRRDNAEIGDLAALCLAKTQGNPFFLGQFLLSLHEKGLIRLDHDSGAWMWNLAAAADIDSTDNVIDLMVAKIRRQEPATVTVLSLAACVGGRFDLADLVAAGEQPAAQLAAALWPALREGLIAPLGHAYRYVEAVQEGWGGKDDTLALGNALHPARARYRFLHDRVQQAAYSLIPEAERAAVHLRIGRRLLAGLAEPERSEDLFDVLDHLNRGAALLGEADERRRLAVLNLAAVRRAKDAAAFEPALRHAQTGIGLLGPVGWEADYALTLTLHEEAAEAAYMSGDPGLMDELAGAVLRRVRSPRDAVRIHYIRVTASMTRSEPLEAVRIGLEALRSIGIHVPEHPSKPTMLWMLLRGKAMLKRRANRPAEAGAPPPDR